MLFLKHLKKKGIIRYSGIIIGDIKTGYQSIESGEVDCLQVLYNLIYQETGELIQEAWKKELGVIVRSPLNSGFLSGAYDYGQTFDPNDARSDFFSGLEFEKRLGLLKKVQKDLSEFFLDRFKNFMREKEIRNDIIESVNELKWYKKYLYKP